MQIFGFATLRNLVSLARLRVAMLAVQVPPLPLQKVRKVFEGETLGLDPLPLRAGDRGR